MYRGAVPLMPMMWNSSGVLDNLDYMLLILMKSLRDEFILTDWDQSTGWPELSFQGLILP